MISRFAAPLGALVLLAATAGTPLAAAAVVATDMTVREGPGDTFKPIQTLVAGMRVDVFECDTHQWCMVEYRGKRGWVHVELAESHSQTADADASAGGDPAGDEKSSIFTRRGRLGGGTVEDEMPADVSSEIALAKPSRF